MQCHFCSWRSRASGWKREHVAGSTIHTALDRGKSGWKTIKQALHGRQPMNFWIFLIFAFLLLFIFFRFKDLDGVFTLIIIFIFTGCRMPKIMEQRRQFKAKIINLRWDERALHQSCAHNWYKSGFGVKEIKTVYLVKL